jgi:hypothetical protein
LRLTSLTSADATPAGPFISRIVSADSVKTRPHHKRAAVTEVVKKEETTVVVSIILSFTGGISDDSRYHIALCVNVYCL